MAISVTAAEEEYDSDFEGGQEHRPPEGAPSPGVREKKRVTVQMSRNAHVACEELKRLDSKMVAERKPTDAERTFLLESVKANRFCKFLDASDLEDICECMDYFHFAQGDVILEQGKPGCHFYCLDSGKLEVSINGKVCNVMNSGSAFGAIALLYGCPRTATVVAKEESGVWAVDGQVFRTVLQEHARNNFAENRKTLDCVRLFDGLSGIQKDRIGTLALHVEAFDAGARVVNEGQTSTAIYIVKTGLCSAYVGGEVDGEGAAAKLNGGAKQYDIQPGDCFGQRAALYGDSCPLTVVASEPTTLVCVGIEELKEMLGGDVAECLEREVKRTSINVVPVVKRLSPNIRRSIADACGIVSFDPQADVGDSFYALCVLEGSLTGRKGDLEVQLGKNEWCQDATFFQLERDCFPTEKLDTERCSGLTGLRAGDGGARCVCLTSEHLLSAENNFSEAEIGTDPESVNYLRKALISQKVPIFRGLSPEKLDEVVRGYKLEDHSQGDKVFQQGEAGCSFYIVCDGQVQVAVDGAVLTTLGPGAAFGERALLLQEARSATVQVCSSTARLWSIDQEKFKAIMSVGALKQLTHEVQLKEADMSMKALKHLRVIGAGAFGSVRLVQHHRTSMKYALKRVRKADGQIPEDVEREKSVLGELNHPFVMRLVDVFETGGSVYLLTELITGGQLYAQTEQMGVLNRKQAQFYIGTLVLILEALHEQGIVYRDLKPENVMLDAQGYLKLVDFGLSRKLEVNEQGLQRAYSVVGTLYYMAPEVILGHGYGPEVDNWSLGVMLYELVIGELPFGAKAEDEQDIVGEILEAPLQFASWYNDIAGKKAIEGFLNRSADHRLGSGIRGWEDAKTTKFFKAGVRGGNLFSKIWGRELDAPIVPDEATYSREEELGVTLSDAEELQTSAATPSPGNDAAKNKVLQTFMRFDMNCDGKIDRSELQYVLQRLDPVTFSDQAIDTLLKECDKNHDGNINFDEFFRWVFTDDANSFRSVLSLDMHE